AEFSPQVDNSAASNFINTVDLGAETDLYLPRFRDYLGFYRFAYGKGKRLLTERFYQGLKERANTHVGLGFEYLLIRDFYAFTQFNSRFGYDFNSSATTRYQINHAALDLLIPTTEPNYDTILLRNQFLRRSFGNQLFVSLLFRNLDYLRIGRAGLRGQSLTINLNFETAGGEVYALNELVNALSNRERRFKAGGTTDFAQYLRGRLELRYNQKYSGNNSLAARFLFGIARPFGPTDAVPYVKQFSAGGANSMRAWAPRGLGPGGFVDSLSLLRRSDSSNLLLYQTGDLQLELNFEYRYKLFWQFKGALFLDIGNVWTLNYANEDRCGSQFRLSPRRSECGGEPFNHQAFYRQLAVAAGTGLRIDLSYFIFRLDAALPLRYNYPSSRFAEGTVAESLYWNNFAGFSFPRSITWQLGLGYPF
ncbi:MAG: BamA/TamA family outer membrane protein, partial [Lewinella sp.]|nr:BamA/TamA family outer membrane protein [Lewinella sp.]